MRITVKSHSLPDRFLFPLVCAFWASQVFLVPLAPIGPWPVWPSLADIIILLLIPAVFLSPRKPAIPVRTICRFALWATVGCAISLSVATLFYGFNKWTLFGGQQFYRSAQIIIVVLATSKVRLTERRIQILARLSLWVFVLNCAAIFATALGVVRSGDVVPLLPGDLSAGPWGSFVDSSIYEGTGFINYNHAYTAVELLVCAALALTLNQMGRFKTRLLSSNRNRFLFQFLLLASLFVTRSRTVFLCVIIFVVMYELKRSKTVLASLGATAALAGMLTFSIPALSVYAERQASSTSSLEDNGFSYRTTNWQEHFDFLAEHPIRAVTGVGFGYNFQTGVSDNAHMLYLHIATELGIVGLGVFLWASWRLLKALRRADCRAMYWCFVALLLTGFAQETFYPTIASLTFMAFFASAVIAAIRIRSAKTATLAVSADPVAVEIVSNGPRLRVAN